MKTEKDKIIEEPFGRNYSRSKFVKEKKCKHKFKHIVILEESMNKENKKKYEWVIHECIKCHKKSDGVKLE